MDVKDKDALYALKVKELQLDDKIYMKGFKSAIDYLVCKAIPEAMDEINNLDNHNIRCAAKWSMDNHCDYMLEKLYDRMFYEMEAMNDFYEGQYIPEDDIPDPKWMDCEKNCQDCREECEKRTEKFLDDGL